MTKPNKQIEKMDEVKLGEFIKESPYSITIKEWNHLKKRISQLVPEEHKLKFHKDGSYASVTLFVSPFYLDIIDTYFRRISHNSYYIFKDEVHELKEMINKELNHHDVCYSPSDSMSDYSGSYRFKSYCSVNADPEYREIFSQIHEMIDGLIKFKREKNEGNAVGLKDFLEICEKYSLSPEFVTRLYNKSVKK